MNFVLLASIALGQAPAVTAIEDLSLKELLGIEVDASTRTTQVAREAPGLITVLTAEDLRRAGCFDLADALRLLPSVELGLDLWNGVGIAVHGNWAHESRVLVLIDGHEWNEIDYGTFALGNRLPAALIERIELIRGPGSAVYGGYASLAVIEITTRAASDDSHSRADVRSTWLGSGVYGRQGVTTSMSRELPDGQVGFAATVGRGRRTDGVFTDVAGTETDLTDASRLDPALLIGSLRTGRLDASVLLASYRATHRDGFGQILPEPLANDFNEAHLRVGWTADLGADWQLIPRASAKWQHPWSSVTVDRPPLYHADNNVYRGRVGFDLRGAPADWAEVLTGAEVGADHGQAPADYPYWWYGETPGRTFRTAAAWGQFIAHSRPVVLVGGIRVDNSDAYGSAVAPRVAASRASDKAHWKVQLSRAFRAPGLQQSRYGVTPEWSTTAEGEVGRAIGTWAYATGSLFDVRATDAIIYGYQTDPVTLELTEGYSNLGRTGSQGGELELSVRTDPVNLTAGWAAYRAVGSAGAAQDPYGVPQQPDVHLGLPAHKAVLRASTVPWRGVLLGGVVRVLGPRWAITGAPDPASPVYARLPAAIVLDLTTDVQLVRGLHAGLDVHDLLDADPPFVQPYDGMHPPLPGAGREVGFHLGASF